MEHSSQGVAHHIMGHANHSLEELEGVVHMHSEEEQERNMGLLVVVLVLLTSVALRLLVVASY